MELNRIMSLFFACYFALIPLWTLSSGFVLKDGRNMHLKKKEIIGNMGVDLDINDKDYEMIDDRLEHLNLHFEDKKFQKIDELVRKEYEKLMITQYSDSGLVKDVDTPKIIEEEIGHGHDSLQFVAPLPLVHLMIKKEATVKTKINNVINDEQDKVNIDSNPEKIYRAVKTEKYDSGFRLLDSIKEIISLDFTSNCTDEDANGIGMRAMMCLFIDIKENNQPYTKLLIRFWNILFVWTIVYLVVVIPLWCSKGWCCCCLWCKFFKPQETIEQAKRYLLLNTPGILVTKKGGIIHYEPTEREKDCYEEFGHFIRTL